MKIAAFTLLTRENSSSTHQVMALILTPKGFIFKCRSVVGSECVFLFPHMNDVVKNHTNHHTSLKRPKKNLYGNRHLNQPHVTVHICI